MEHISIGTSAAILSDWVCSAITLLILLGRLAGDRITGNADGVSIAATGISILLLLARAACDTIYLLFGSTDILLREPNYQSIGANLSRLQIGSVVVLVCRLLVTTFYWLQCCILLLLYRRLFGHINRSRIAIKICWALIAATWVAVVLTTFLECSPFRLYYQVHPQPSKCILAYGQLLVQGVSNIVIDLSLLFISFPMLRIRTSGTWTTVRLTAVYALGTFAIIVSCVRVGETFRDQSNQVERSIWASIQALTAALVANLSSCYGGIVVAKRRWYGNGVMLATHSTSNHIRLEDATDLAVVPKSFNVEGSSSHVENYEHDP